MPKFTMIQSVRSLFCEFTLLHTLLCRTMLIVEVFCCTNDSEYTGKTNRMYIFVCLRKSYCSHGLSVMRLDIGTINSFCLDDGVGKILLM